MKLQLFSGAALVAVTCIIISSCFRHYYRTSSPEANNNTADSIIKNQPQRVFILRAGNSAFAMNDMVVSADRKSLTCILEQLPKKYQHHKSNRSYRYKIKSAEAAVLNEVHLYIPLDKITHGDTRFTLQLSDINKIEVFEKDHGTTIGSYVLGFIGVSAASFAVAVIIVAATKSSCPFVSVYNGKEFSLQGEIFGGAIYPQLARNDYMRLEMAPTQKDRLEVKISNELKEQQFTDLARLLVVTHDKKVRMVVDETGNLHTLSAPELPKKASAGTGDVLSLVDTQNDQKAFAFNDTSAKSGHNEILLQFSNNGNAKKGKLILRLKNSYWLDYMYGKMTEGMGTYYSTYAEVQSARPAEDIKRWTKEQQVPLSVSLHTPKGWEPVTNITTTGPLAYREIVVPVSLPATTTGQVEIRLSAGFMFWEIDYAAMDFSDNAPFLVNTLNPAKAIDEAGKEVSHLLKEADGVYLHQPSIGNVVRIEYKSPLLKDASKTQSFFLHSKGYYLHIRDYKTKPNLAFLQQFKQPGGLSQYSMEVYKEAVAKELSDLVKH